MTTRPGPAAPDEPDGPDGPRWLDAEQQAAWRLWLPASRLVDEALDRQLQRDAGMPHSYYHLLVVLSEAPDRTLRMSELARLTSTSQSRSSHAVARLEESGWVRRTRARDDRRGQVAALTDAGLAALAAAATGHVATVRDALFSAMDGADVAQLARLLGGVVRGLDPDEPALRFLTAAGPSSDA